MHSHELAHPPHPSLQGWVVPACPMQTPFSSLAVLSLAQLPFRQEPTALGVI